MQNRLISGLAMIYIPPFPGLIVETGVGLVNSNAYVSLADAEAILQGMQGIPDYATAWVPSTNQEKASAIIGAASYLEAKYRWYGVVLTETQAMQWPRTKNYDEGGRVILAGVIPSVLKRMNALLALYWVKDEGLFNEVTELGAPKSVSTDGFSVTMGSSEGKGGLAFAESLVGKRFPEVELALKNLGEFKEMGWFKSRRTDARVLEMK